MEGIVLQESRGGKRREALTFEFSTVLELFHLFCVGGIRVETIGFRKGGHSLLGLGGKCVGAVVRNFG